MEDKMDLDSFLDQAESMNSLVKKEKNRSSSKHIHYEINEKKDSDLLILLKNLINQSDIYYQDVYDKYGKSVGNNMIQSIKKGQLSWTRFVKWADVAGYDVEINLIKQEDKQD